MKNYKGFGKMTDDDYRKKMNHLNVSHLMQCYDLSNAYNQEQVDDETRSVVRKKAEIFVGIHPTGSFIDFTICLGADMLENGFISKGQFLETLGGMVEQNDITQEDYQDICNKIELDFQ